jgi:hypothetical protein
MNKSITHKHYNYLTIYNDLLKWKVMKMPKWMAWVLRPSGQINVEGSASAF